VIVLGIIGLIVDFLPKIAIVWTLGTIALVFGAALTGEVPEPSRDRHPICSRCLWSCRKVRLPAEEGDLLVAGAGRAGQAGPGWRTARAERPR
jgi:hypothetical protein